MIRLFADYADGSFCKKVRFAGEKKEPNAIVDFVSFLGNRPYISITLAKFKDKAFSMVPNSEKAEIMREWAIKNNRYSVSIENAERIKKMSKNLKGYSCGFEFLPFGSIRIHVPGIDIDTMPLTAEKLDYIERFCDRVDKVRGDVVYCSFQLSEWKEGVGVFGFVENVKNSDLFCLRLKNEVGEIFDLEFRPKVYQIDFLKKQMRDFEGVGIYALRFFKGAC